MSRPEVAALELDRHHLPWNHRITGIRRLPAGTLQHAMTEYYRIKIIVGIDLGLLISTIMSYEVLFVILVHCESSISECIFLPHCDGKASLANHGDS